MATAPSKEDPSRISGDEWSNRKCIEIAFEDFFPSIVSDLKVQKNIIEKFLNFYLSGKVPTGLSVYDLVYSTMSIMPLHLRTEEFIWDTMHYKENGTLFFLTPEDKLNVDVKAALQRSMNVKMDNDKSNNNKKKRDESPDHDNNKNEDFIPNIAKEEKVTNNIRDKSPNHDNNHKNENDTNKPSTSKQNLNDSVNNLSHDSNRNSKRPSMPKTIRWFSINRPRTAPGINVEPEYGPKENAAFVSCCNNMLTKWDSSKWDRIFLRYFFGTVATIMMRSTTKSYKHLNTTFRRKMFMTYIEDSIKADLRCTPTHLDYSIPHKKCIKKCYRSFYRRGLDVRCMFAKLIINSYNIDAKRRSYTHTSSPLDRNIFKVNVLAHTADYGLGLLSLLKSTSQLDINIVIEATYCDETAESWEKLGRFVYRYMDATNSECTHYWARVIDGHYFRDLSCGNNAPLATILAVFIENLSQKPDIWQSAWVSRVQNLQTYKAQGMQMFDNYERSKELYNLRMQKQIMKELLQGKSNENNADSNENNYEQINMANMVDENNEEPKEIDNVLKYVESVYEKKFVQGIGDRKKKIDLKLEEELEDIEDHSDLARSDGDDQELKDIEDYDPLRLQVLDHRTFLARSDGDDQELEDIEDHSDSARSNGDDQQQHFDDHDFALFHGDDLQQYFDDHDFALFDDDDLQKRFDDNNLYADCNTK